MRRPLLLAASTLALALVTLATNDAEAFCRTRTVAVPANYDATVNDCKTDGLPLFWRNSCVGYSIQRDASKKISYDDVSNLMSEAFTRWTGTTCSPPSSTGSSRVSIDVRDLGPVDCSKFEYHGGVPNQNVIVFRDDSWPYDKQVLGLTHVQYDTTTGEIYGADMEINTYDMDPLKTADPVGPRDYDFLSVVTHEAGHFLGMAHSNVTHTTMFWEYDPGQTAQRELAPDDIDGICSIYLPDGTRTVLNSRVTAAPQCDPTPRGGYTTACYESSCAATKRDAAPELGAGILVALTALVTKRRARRSPERPSSR